MPLLTPALTDAAVLLRHVQRHLGTGTCLDHDRPQTRVHALSLRDAAATICTIDELDDAVRITAMQLDGDLIALHLLLAAHANCTECRRLADDTARVHLDLGFEL